MQLNNNLIYADESYKIIGVCMQVHTHLGRGGFAEVVIKDALQYEFDLLGIEYSREVAYDVRYKGVVLPHKFYADFVVMNKIILEVKNCTVLTSNHAAQSLNYLAVSNLKLALLVNFGAPSLEHKRLIL